MGVTLVTSKGVVVVYWPCHFQACIFPNPIVIFSLLCGLSQVLGKPFLISTLNDPKQYHYVRETCVFRLLSPKVHYN